MKITTEVPDYIVDIVKSVENIGRRELAKIARISEQSARIYLNILKDGVESRGVISEQDVSDKVVKDYKDNTATITTTSLTINTLEQALEVAEVDLERWDVDRWVCNSWGVTMKIDDTPVYRTNYQVKVWLKARVIKPIELAMRALIDRLPKHKPQYCKEINFPIGKIMLEISLFDAHFGLLAWGDECGEDYDVHVAEEIYPKAVKKLLERSSHFDIGKIIFPVGNDFFHLNNPEGTTPKAGNILDIDSRLPKIYQAGKMSIIKAIDYCIGVAPVELIWVPGNHDPEISYYLCDALKAHYSTTDKVSVDIKPKFRKYRQWGQGMVGFTHGDEEPHRDLPAIMAGEAKEMWANTSYREFHLGHLHKKKQMFTMAGDTYNGVITRIIPSIASIDAWHYKKGYINKIKAGEAFAWHKDEGVINNITVMVDNL